MLFLEVIGYMTIYPNLTRELKNRKLTVEIMAEDLGYSRSAMYRRMNGSIDWTLSEIVAICQYLENFDINTLFLRLHTKT